MGVMCIIYGGLGCAARLGARWPDVREWKSTRRELPGAASLAWLLSPVLWETEHPGLEERPRANISLGSSFLGCRDERGQLV